MRTKTLLVCAAIAVALAVMPPATAVAQVKPGETITKANAYKVKTLLSPGNYILVQRGMRIHVVPTSYLEWPPPYRDATEKYASQVRLGANEGIENYVAGQPFPLLDPNDPKIALKIMWNFSFRPLYTDDLDLRYPEVESYAPDAHGTPTGTFTVGHFAFYNEVGRTEVPPVPASPDYKQTGIRFRFGYYPFLNPSLLRGFGLVRYRYMDPTIEDNTWVFSPQSRRLRRESQDILSDAISMVPGFGGGAGGAYGGGGPGGGATPFVTTIDPNSYFGFSAKIPDYKYKFLGEKDMLASVHAKFSPEHVCPYDGGHTICPEDWEMRHLYVIQADAKSTNLAIPRRILYIDSEGWFMTASDQYDREGRLWKTLASFHTYRDRPVPDAKIAIYPFKRMFQLALVDYDLQTSASSIVFMPGPNSPERECWYIDMGVVTPDFFTPEALRNAGH